MALRRAFLLLASSWSINAAVNCLSSTTTMQSNIVNALDGDVVAFDFEGHQNLVYWSGTRLYRRSYEQDKITFEDTFLAGKTDSGGTPVNGVGASAVIADAQIGQSGLAYSNGEVYFVDFGAVRKVNIETGEVSRVTGAFGVAAAVDGDSTTARFTVDNAGGKAGGIALAGNFLYVMEQSRIRRVDITTGEVVSLTQGGSFFFDFTKPTDVAYSQQMLYITDEQQGVIYKVELDADTSVTAVVSFEVLAGTKDSLIIKDGIQAKATFAKPTYLSLIGENLYVSDSDANVMTLRKIHAPSGLTTTVLSNGEVRATSDGVHRFADGDETMATIGMLAGTSADSEGNLWILDSSAKKIRKMSFDKDSCPGVCDAPACGDVPFNLCEDRGDGTRTCLCLDQNYKATDDQQDCKIIALEPTPAPTEDLGACSAILFGAAFDFSATFNKGSHFGEEFVNAFANSADAEQVAGIAVVGVSGCTAEVCQDDHCLNLGWKTTFAQNVALYDGTKYTTDSVTGAALAVANEARAIRVYIIPPATDAPTAVPTVAPTGYPTTPPTPDPTPRPELSKCQSFVSDPLCPATSGDCSSTQSITQGGTCRCTWGDIPHECTRTTTFDCETECKTLDPLSLVAEQRCVSLDYRRNFGTYQGIFSDQNTCLTDCNTTYVVMDGNSCFCSEQDPLVNEGLYELEFQSCLQRCSDGIHCCLCGTGEKDASPVAFGNFNQFTGPRIRTEIAISNLEWGFYVSNGTQFEDMLKEDLAFAFSSEQVQINFNSFTEKSDHIVVNFDSIPAYPSELENFAREVADAIRSDISFDKLTTFAPYEIRVAELEPIELYANFSATSKIVGRINMNPIFNPLPDIVRNMNSGMQTITVSGIQAGADKTEVSPMMIGVEALAGDSLLQEPVAFSYVSPASTAQIFIVPKTSVSGRISIRVTLYDEDLMSFTDTFDIDILPQKLDCEYSEWTEWSSCDKYCGSGLSNRQRSIVVEGVNGGLVCDPTKLVETKHCNTQPCGAPLLDSIPDVKYAMGSGEHSIFVGNVVSSSPAISVQALSRNLQLLPNPGAFYSSSTKSIVLQINVPSWGSGVVTVDVMVSDEYAGQASTVSFQVEITGDSVPSGTNSNCVLGWGEWSACSKTCGGGMRTQRQVVLQVQTGTGVCGTLQTRSEVCNANSCTGAASSCQGKCGGSAEGCMCDDACSAWNDCCEDYSQQCLFGDLAPSCSGRCGSGYNVTQDCGCNADCELEGNCCADYTDVCYTGNSCDGRCGLKGQGGSVGSTDCWCDSHCAVAGDCCADYIEECPQADAGSSTCANRCDLSAKASVSQSKSALQDLHNFKNLYKQAAKGIDNSDEPTIWDFLASQASAVGATAADSSNPFRKEGETCTCDLNCATSGTCCNDFWAQCGASLGATCEGNCGNNQPLQQSGSPQCYCDSLCAKQGDCCFDYLLWCDSGAPAAPTPVSDSNTCSGRCGLVTPTPGGCYCDDQCNTYGDCCADWSTTCLPVVFGH